MSNETIVPEQLSDVLRLCTLLAERVLDAQIMARPVSADQVVALAKAARLLQDLGVEWPPLLTNVVHELADRKARPVPEVKPPDGIDLQSLTGFLTDLWKEKKR